MITQAAPIKRFFSPVVALVALGVLALGGVITAACVNSIVNEQRINVKACLLGGALVLAGIAVFFLGAFKKGCSSCRKTFTLAYAPFPPSTYERLEGIVNSDDPAAIRSLANAEQTRGNHRASIEVSHCPNCRAVGELRVIEMANNGQYEEFKRGTKPRAVSSEVLKAALELVDSR